MQITINNNILTMIVSDITKQETEAIVNAANGSLLGGGGVDGAIHRAAGPELVKECRKVRLEQLNGALLPTGQSVITKAYRLPSKYVIHTVGPVWNGGNSNESELLYNCYMNSFKLARENQIKSISFPSISTGIYAFPIQLASEVAIKTIFDFLEKNQFGEVTMVLFSQKDYEVYVDSLKLLNSNY
jgi:O-acetyl-ADP-ribose deacetylase